MSDYEFEVVHAMFMGRVMCHAKDGRVTEDPSLVTCPDCDEARERIAEDGP